MAGWSMLRSVGRRIGVKGVDEGVNLLDAQLDDWELAGEEDQNHHHDHDRLPNFGSAPAEKDVQVTASNLQDTLAQDSIPVNATFDDKTAPLSSPSVQEISESIEAGTLEHKIASSSSSSMHEISYSVEAGTFDHKKASLSFSSVQDETSDSVETANIDHKMASSSPSPTNETLESIEGDTFDNQIALSSTSLVHEISDSVEEGTFDHKSSSPSSSPQDEISHSVEADTFDHKPASSPSSSVHEISISIQADTFDHKLASSPSSSVHEISDSIQADTFGHETASSSSLMPERSDLVEASGIQEILNRASGTSDNQMELELHEDNYRMLQKVGHNNVREAFNLLRDNPAIQRMVMSVASDKAVLDALLKNEKVHEFRRSFQQGEIKLLETSKDSDKSSFHQENPFFRTIENIKTKVMEFTEKTTEVVNQFLGFTDKKILLEKDGDMDRALKASLILFVVLLVTVLVRRV